MAAKPPPLGTVTNGQRSRIPQSRKSMIPVPKPVDISDTAEEPEKPLSPPPPPERPDEPATDFGAFEVSLTPDLASISGSPIVTDKAHRRLTAVHRPATAPAETTAFQGVDDDAPSEPEEAALPAAQPVVSAASPIPPLSASCRARIGSTPAAVRTPAANVSASPVPPLSASCIARLSAPRSKAAPSRRSSAGSHAPSEKSVASSHALSSQPTPQLPSPPKSVRRPARPSMSTPSLEGSPPKSIGKSPSTRLTRRGEAQRPRRPRHSGYVRPPDGLGVARYALAAQLDWKAGASPAANGWGRARDRVSSGSAVRPANAADAEVAGAFDDAAGGEYEDAQEDATQTYASPKVGDPELPWIVAATTPLSGRQLRLTPARKARASRTYTEIASAAKSSNRRRSSYMPSGGRMGQPTPGDRAAASFSRGAATAARMMAEQADVSPDVKEAVVEALGRQLRLTPARMARAAAEEEAEAEAAAAASSEPVFEEEMTRR